ncbi:MAG: hypothetical protein WCO69_03675 [Candidatus Omnitrophota bacterium]
MDKEKDRLFFVWLFGVALLGGVAVLAMTAPYGLGITAGSVASLQAAKNFLLGNGLSSFDQAGLPSPLTTHSPVFPLLLSAAWFLGLSFTEWARFLNTAFFMASIFLAGCIVYRWQGGRFSSLLVSLAFLFCAPLVMSCGILSSGPLFFVLVLLWLWASLVYAGSGGRAALSAAAFCAGLLVLLVFRPAFLSSFNGVPVWFWIPTLVILVIVLNRPLGYWDTKTISGKVILFVLVCSFGLAGTLAVRAGVDLYRSGYGYSSKASGASKLAVTLRSLDDRVPVYSNDPAGVYYFTGRPAVKIPEGVADRLVMKDDFVKRRAVAVLFTPESFRPGKKWDELAVFAGLEALFKDGAGNILGVRKK